MQKLLNLTMPLGTSAYTHISNIGNGFGFKTRNGVSILNDIHQLNQEIKINKSNNNEKYLTGKLTPCPNPRKDTVSPEQGAALIFRTFSTIVIRHQP